jgi:hypothetical protein
MAEPAFRAWNRTESDIYWMQEPRRKIHGQCPLMISLLPLQWPTAESERLGVTVWHNVSKTNWRFSRGSSVLKIVV